MFRVVSLFTLNTHTCMNNGAQLSRPITWLSLNLVRSECVCIYTQFVFHTGITLSPEVWIHLPSLLWHRGTLMTSKPAHTLSHTCRNWRLASPALLQCIISLVFKYCCMSFYSLTNKIFGISFRLHSLFMTNTMYSSFLFSVVSGCSGLQRSSVVSCVCWVLIGVCFPQFTDVPAGTSAFYDDGVVIRKTHFRVADQIQKHKRMLNVLLKQNRCWNWYQARSYRT